MELTRSDVRAGDHFVLCSDGLWDLVSRAEIAEATRAPRPDEAAEAMLASALERGAPDNVTVVVVRVNDVPSVPPVSTTKPWWAFLRGDA